MAVIGINVKLTLPTIPASSALFLSGMGLTARIRSRFQTEAGTLLLDAIRAHLGTSALYTLTPEYAARKPGLKGFRRESGKSGDQPIILSGALYDALTVIPTLDGFTVQVEDGEALSDKGYDYAELWQAVTDYLGKGLADVEHRLDEVLADIIVDEMML